MAESLKISKQPPELESMRYSSLRELGIEHIQELASKLWTDFNSHDPGVTILEVLCYAITDLGHRSNQNIENILAQNPADPDSKDIKNFFTAAQILPNKPLTLSDISKLVLDVSVTDDSNPDCDFVGVKNAWVNLANQSEVPIWPWLTESKLAYEPKPEAASNPKKMQLEMQALYDILLEFESCETHGDLNQHIENNSMTVGDSAGAELKGLIIRIETEFPRWDTPDIDWENVESIRKEIRKIDLSFLNRPGGYTLHYKLGNENAITLSGTAPGNAVLELNAISDELNDLVDQIVTSYQEKVRKIFEIVTLAKVRLHANRNLCEDFYRFHALKVEGIAVCADIELELEADVEEVQAQIYHRIATFLSPSVNFYSLKELMDSGTPTEEIFEGPLLNHGFIPEEELKKTERKKVIYVSDLIQIIMNIDGVVAVKHIEIANIPQGNEENIPSKSVKWCLKLAHEYNYVPRLSVPDSKITFHKDQLPYHANQSVVDERLRDLESGVRSQKIRNPELDLKISRGHYLDLQQYTSIQEEFPDNYGVGTNGLSATAEKQRKAETNQLKGFLMFFDQLLANYMAQLAHVKDLFSMNADKDDEGNYKIGRTYYTQPLTDIVPQVEVLYSDINQHPANLDQIAESPELFFKRRNKFLDHLMARFSEQFTDYATLTYRLAGKEGKRDLVHDKLSLLNAYPEISSGRGTAFNYRHPCRLWYIENKSGLEKRAALQVGVDDKQPDELVFSKHFIVTGDNNEFGFEVRDSDTTVLLTQPAGKSFKDETQAKEVLEELIINGVFREKYIINENEGSWSFALTCDDTPLGESKNKNYGNKAEAVESVDKLIQIFEMEFCNNTESNRNNFAAPVDNYFEIKTHVTEAAYKIEYTLYYQPFSFDSGDALLHGVREGVAASNLEAERELEERKDEFIWEVISNGSLKERYTEFEDTDGTDKLRLNGRFGQQLGESAEKEISAGELAKFFTDKFFSNEGLHLVEHILLRPKYNDYHFAPADKETLKDADELGKAIFSRIRDIISIVKTGKKVRVNGDITSGLIAGSTLHIVGTEDNDGEYEVDSSQYDEDNDRTEIKLKGGSLDTDTNPAGQLLFENTFPVKSVDPENRVMVLDGNVQTPEDETFQLKGSTDGVNDGTYKVTSASPSGSKTDVTIGAKEVWIQDKLMSIQYDPDCEHCQLTNPYKYVATIVLPHWQGRFGNMDFRKFLERKIRYEAPAHIFLKICWVSNRHMMEFEQNYKKWLVQNAREEKNPAAWSAALKELICTLEGLRNVYPVGRLHDCEEAETLEGSMILNHSILGSA